MTPRITRPEPPHREACRGLANHPYIHGATDGKPWIKHPGHKIDEIRRCKHGIIQICYWPDRRGPNWASCPHPLEYEWRDISKVWERGLYKKAITALEEEAARA